MKRRGETEGLELARMRGAPKNGGFPPPHSSELFHEAASAGKLGTFEANKTLHNQLREQRQDRPQLLRASLLRSTEPIPSGTWGPRCAQLSAAGMLALSVCGLDASAGAGQQPGSRTLPGTV